MYSSYGKISVYILFPLLNWFVARSAVLVLSPSFSRKRNPLFFHFGVVLHCILSLLHHHLNTTLAFLYRLGNGG